MLQGERVTVSVMTVSPTAEPSLSVSLRSTEVLGEIKELPTTTGRERKLAFTGAILSSLSVAAMGVILGFLTRAGFFARARARGSYHDKSDIITLIAGLSQVVPLTEQLLLRNHDVTYARAADAFLMVGLEADAPSRQRCVLGLRALALIDEMADKSIEIVRNNLKELNSGFSDEDFEAHRVKAKGLSNSELRYEIIKLFKIRTPKKAVRAE